MVKHWMLKHHKIRKLPKFRFKVLALFRDCLPRQIGEALIILYSKDFLLNSQSEYGSNCLTRVTVPEEAYKKTLRERR